MLHSALPRAFLPPPGLCYLGGYYGESVHPYSSVARFLPLENTYASIQGNHRAISPLELARSVSPSPLDLSLKPISRYSPRTVDVETIEVDDVEDQRNDGFGSAKKYSQNWDTQRGSEDLLQSPVPRSFVYEDLYHENSSAKGSTMLTTNLPYSNEAIQDYTSPSSSPLSSQKLLLSSPSSIRSMHTYQQQLLLTPQNHLQSIHAPMTPPSTPSPPQCPRRRPRDEDETTPSNNTTPIIQTPKSSNEKSSQRPKKKHARRLKFDEDTSSPVSGTVILGPDEAVVTGDIDPAFNIVEVTEEARAELAKIENRLGPYQCKLCQQLHDDAFQLAQHRCSRIAHVEYRCPECDKRFSCPANLASHRRWHKPRVPAGEAASLTPTSSTIEIPCNKCDAKFTRQAALRKHLTTQHPEPNNNSAIVNINNNNICMETSNDSMISPKPHVDGMPLWVAPHSSEMA